MLYRTGLLSAKSLRRLHLGGSDITLENGIMPVLTTGAGMALRKLVLEAVSGAAIDVAAIGDACLALEALAISLSAGAIPNHQCLVPVAAFEGARFQRLRSLELWCGPVATAAAAASSALRQLLLPPRRLRHLLFQGVAAADDDLLLSVWSSNPMLDLSNVVFDRCHGFTVRLLTKEPYFNFLISDTSFT